jgi:hypothetical protein
MANFVWENQPQQNSGQFDSSPYGNPQMGAYGGFSPQNAQGWYNPASQMEQWQNQFAPAGAAWQNMGQAPGSFGGSSWYNPQTGQQQTQSGDILAGYYGNSNAIQSTNPYTGQTYINPGALMGMFGGMFGDGGGYNPYEMTQFSGGQISAPGAYGGGDWGRPEALSAAETIEAYRPMMEEEIGQGFAQAGNRMGQSGMAMSTPYAEALGRVEDLARNKMNARALEYTYDATKFDRNQEMARQMAQNAEMFGGWQQQGAWDMAAQQGNVGNAMQQWMLENQLGFQGNQAQNQWNQQNQMNQQQWLAQLLGGLL